MGRGTPGYEHVEAAQDCLTDLVKARGERDWPRVTALAAAAQAHLAMASLARDLALAPSSSTTRDIHRWQAAAGFNP